MRRAAAVLLLALAASSCAHADSTSTAGASSTTAGAATSTTTTAADVITTTALPTHLRADRLVGTGVWGEWDVGGQFRLLRGDGLGGETLWMHLEACVPAPGESCGWRLVFAARPSTPPLALEAGYDGVIFLARLRAHEALEVLDVVAAVDVVLAPGSGTAAALGASFEGPFWAAELAFTSGGLTVRRAWWPDTGGGALVPADPATAGLPDVSAWAGAGPVLGRVVTVQAYAAAPDDPHHVLDLSGAAPVRLAGLREVGGETLPGGGSLAWLETVPGEPSRLVWLEQFLGWSYTGSSLWRVRDAVEFGAVPGADAGYFCRHETSNDAAVALVESAECAACPVVSAEAFRVDLTAWRFAPVPPESVTCACECGA